MIGVLIERRRASRSFWASSVKELARLYRLGEIEISVKDAFLFPQRPSQKATIRSDDATTARQGRDNRLSFTQGLLADWAGGAAQPESDAERLPTRLGDSRRAVLLERCGTSLRLLGSGTGDVALDQSECRCPLRLRPVSITDADFARLPTIGLSPGTGPAESCPGHCNNASTRRSIEGRSRRR